jgi:RNA polymerase sigma-70 factor (ECF subfamily)
VIDRIALREAIDQLAPGYRLVLMLHDVEGYEHQEIARMLGCAVGTSKSQLHKARLKVRELLIGRRKPVAKPLCPRSSLTSQLKFQVPSLCRE